MTTIACCCAHLHRRLLLLEYAQQLCHILAKALVKHGVSLVNDQPAAASQSLPWHGTIRQRISMLVAALLNWGVAAVCLLRP
jgi:hypothetical protein